MEIEQEKTEGLDELEVAGWGDYPLDSVFVRTEQRTVSEVVKRIDAGRVKLDPEFQRDFVWKVDRQSKLIESCLMRIPLPVLYVAEAKDGRIIVVDGLQRLTTFKRFISNEFPLTGLAKDGEIPHPMNGMRFRDLPVNLQERVEDTQLTLYILDSKAPDRAKLDIFDRVNGGVPLTRQQMRNCLYNGKATNWLKEAAEGAPFCLATGRSLDKRAMRDREAINRFCAFSLIGSQHYTSSDMDQFLADALERMNASDDASLAGLRERFDRSMQVNRELFGEHAFRKSIARASHNAARSVINIALFDVCSTLFAAYQLPLGDDVAQTLRSGIHDLLSDENFVQAITYSTNSTRPVATRFRMARTRLGIGE
jgi:hypothetical protein